MRNNRTTIKRRTRSGARSASKGVGACNQSALAWLDRDPHAVMSALGSRDAATALRAAGRALRTRGSEAAQARFLLTRLALVRREMQIAARRGLSVEPVTRLSGPSTTNPAGSDTVMVTLPDPVLVEGVGLTRGVLLVSIPMLRAAGEQAVTGDGGSALAVVWRGRTRPANTARRDPILPRIVIQSAHPARARGELLTAPGGRAGLRAAALPLIPDADHDLLSVPLLDVADIATGVRAVSSGHGASHEIRLLVEGVLSISAGDREGDGIPIAWTVGELLQALYASSKHMHRAGDRPGDWELIRRAALWVDHAAIPWRGPSGNLQSWFLMRLRTLPGERPGWDDPVVFDVRLPPGAGIGPVIDREALRAAARVSSPAYRIGIGVPSLTWIPGVTRPPMRGPGGVWTGDPRRYPVLSDRDRRRIAFGPDDERKQAHVDDAWRKRADAAGVVILDTEAVDRDGKRGWHVVTIAAAEAIRKARRKG